MTFATDEAPDSPDPRVVRAAAIPAAEIPGHSFRVVADGAATGGAFSVTEATSPKGASVGFHAHDACVECFYVMEGLYRLNISAVPHEVGQGQFALVPGGAPHGFEVLDGPARALVLFAPAGFEEVFRAMPKIFARPGEPGPLFEAANRAATTRLLDGRGPGPAALVRPKLTAPESTLAGLSDTRTGLRVVLRHDAETGDSGTLDPATVTVCVLDGGYRLDLPGPSLSVRAGDFVTPPAGARLTAAALAPGSRLLLLCLDH